jgi:hypothetical protein
MLNGKPFHRKWRHEPIYVYKFAFYSIIFLIVYTSFALFTVITSNKWEEKFDVIILFIVAIGIFTYLISWGYRELIKNKEGMIYITSQSGYLSVIDGVKEKLTDNSQEYTFEESTSRYFFLHMHRCTFLVHSPNVRIEISPMPFEDGIYVDLGPINKTNIIAIREFVDVLDIE